MKIQVSDLALTEGEGSPHSHTATKFPHIARHLPQTSPLSPFATLPWPLLATEAIVFSPDVGTAEGHLPCQYIHSDR